MTTSSALRELQSLKYDFHPRAGLRKFEILSSLAHRRLASARQVLEFHELLCTVAALR